MENITGKILIVDDEQINLDFFDIMLSKLGFEIDRAEDGEEALDRIKESDPDLIILDNIMPKMSGWEVTRILKEQEEYKKYKNTPIIMFSAMDEVKDKIEGFELGVDDYITKPFNFSEVLARIRAVLRNHELSKQIAKRERRIALIESLNQSLIYFTDHLRQPVLSLLESSKDLDVNSEKQINDFVEKVRKEADETLAALDGLQEEISELQSKDYQLKEHELTKEDLEEKFQKHFARLKEEHTEFDEV